MTWSNLWEKLQARAVELVLVGLGAIIPAGLVSFAQARLAAYVVEYPVVTVWLIAGLMPITLWSFAAFLYYRPRLRFDRRLGIYQDRKTGTYYCTSCNAKKLRTPLQEREVGWSCNVTSCGMFYRNPEYVAPSRHRQKG